MKAADKLRAYWSKREADVILYHPLGVCTKSDGHYLAGIFDKEFTRQMDVRGYDVETLRFEICPKAGEDRFASTRLETP